MRTKIVLTIFFVSIFSVSVVGNPVEKTLLPLVRAKEVVEKAGLSADFRLRLAAVKAAGELPSAFTPFLLRMTEDVEEQVRGEAVIALSRLEKRDELVSRLSHLAKNDQSWLVRYQALLALSRISPDNAYPIACSFAESSLYQLNIVSCFAFHPDKGKYPLTPLKKLSDHPDFRVRAAALSVLVELNDEKATPSLKKLIESEEPEVVKVVTLFIGELKGEKGIALIENKKDDKSAKVREALAIALGKTLIKEESLLKKRAGMLAHLLNDDKPEVRLAALSSLASLRRKEDIPLFKKALADPEWRVIEEAVKALSSFCLPEEKGAIIPLLSHPSPEVRGEAVFAMGILGADGEMPRLPGLLTDRDSEVRIKAAIALALLGDTRGANELNRIMVEGNEEERIISSLLIIKATALIKGGIR